MGNQRVGQARFTAGRNLLLLEQLSDALLLALTGGGAYHSPETTLSRPERLRSAIVAARLVNMAVVFATIKRGLSANVADDRAARLGRHARQLGDRLLCRLFLRADAESALRNHRLGAGLVERRVLLAGRPLPVAADLLARRGHSAKGELAPPAHILPILANRLLAPAPRDENHENHQEPFTHFSSLLTTPMETVRWLPCQTPDGLPGFDQLIILTSFCDFVNLILPLMPLTRFRDSIKIGYPLNF